MTSSDVLTCRVVETRTQLSDLYGLLPDADFWSREARAELLRRIEALERYAEDTRVRALDLRGAGEKGEGNSKDTDYGNRVGGVR